MRGKENGIQTSFVKRGGPFSEEKKGKGLVRKELAEAISNKQSKIALFAYRVKPEKTKEDFDYRVSARMKVLDSLNRNLSKTLMYSSMSNGFLFTEIKYPDVYIW